MCYLYRIWIIFVPEYFRGSDEFSFGEEVDLV